ncbi:putative ribonuclease H-like domain-containing protein [Tanacetum coccineum]
MAPSPPPSPLPSPSHKRYRSPSPPLPPLPSSPPSDMLPLRKRVRITPLQTETSEETVDETHTQTTAPTRLCKKSEARRWTFLISKFHIWRDKEVAPSTYEIEESSTANVLLVTGESVHHTVSLVVARLISHTRLIEEIHEHLRVVSLERIETLEQEVETMRDRAKIVCHEDTEARLQQSEAGVIELKVHIRRLEDRFGRESERDLVSVQVWIYLETNEIYVDDIIFGSTKKELCEEFEKLMKDKFQMSSMGELTFFLGLQVQQKKKGIFISQDKYVHEILKKFNYTDVKSASTPTDLERPLVKDSDADDVDEHLYRSMIGSLMYLTASRPDIMFAVCACARFQVSPKTSHLLAVKRIFRYLKGKPSLGLWYSKDSPLELVAYTDSDYAGATLDRKSTTGGCQFLGNRLISWQCKKQTVVATSTTEAEYVAAANCCGQVLWIQNQLLDYGYNFMSTIIYIDNTSTICIIENPVQHSKTKHIEIRHHFIRDCNTKKLIQMAKIDTQLNVADLLTKGFDAGRFQYLVSSIGMLNP